MTYALNQKEYLCAFLEHGEVDISNYFAENTIRPFAVGRKNWFFCDTPKGADSSAIVYTMVETAKANGLDPYDYLLNILGAIPYLGKNPAEYSGLRDQPVRRLRATVPADQSHKSGAESH